RIEVTSALNGGKTDEKHILRKSLQPDRCYVLDRWYAEFALWNDIVAAGSSYVCRIRDNSNLDEVVEERPVSEAARRAGVLRDMFPYPFDFDQFRGAGRNRCAEMGRLCAIRYRGRALRLGGTAMPESADLPELLA